LESLALLAGCGWHAQRPIARTCKRADGCVHACGAFASRFVVRVWEREWMRGS
jgi:hypothetical protein